jgi:hypothetical protein
LSRSIASENQNEESSLSHAAHNNSFRERFFIVPHKKICAIQKARNKRYAAGYFKRHGKQPDFSSGVDNVTVDDVSGYEDKWNLIVDRMEASHPL